MQDSRLVEPRLADVYAEWLESFQWDHWMTLTFGPYLPPESPGLGPPKPPPPRPGPPPDFGHRAFDRYMNDLRRRVRAPLWWFRGDEFGAQGGRLHLHALVGGTDGLSLETLRNAWRPGFSFIKPYDPALGATHYVAKYVVKDLADYDISGHFRRLWERPLTLLES